MDKGRWQRAERLFRQALGLAAADREGFVRASGAGSATRDLVLDLLAEDARGGHTVEAIVQRAAGAAVGDTQDRLSGTRLGPWRIVRHIADGGMGAVYLAERADGLFEQRAAVKLMNPALVSRQARDRLAAERQILARLQHRHIARLLDGGTTDDGAPYLVMEFVDGAPIDAYCDDHGLDTVQRLRLMQQVCSAVEHAHRNLIVHRDLKPSNILVDDDGLPKLLDFGIAKLIDDDAGLTRADQRLLTPSYASPEQIRGEPVTTATDIYALGVLMYRLLARRNPFPADPTRSTHAAALAREILETDPRRPSAAIDGALKSDARLRRELSGDLDNIVLMALQKDPLRRYPSALALAEDIENHLQLRPVRAHGDSLAYRWGKGLRRQWRAVGAAALLVVTVSALTVYYTSQLARERDFAQSERATAEQVTAFMGELFDNASPEVQADPNRTVRDVVTAAAERVPTQLAGQPEAQLRLLRILGRVHRHLGEWADSAALLKQAVAIGDTPGFAPTPELGRAWAELSNILSQRSEYDDAIAAGRRAYETFDATLGPDDFETVEAYIGIATKLTSAGRPDEAVQILETARGRVPGVAAASDRELLDLELGIDLGKLYTLQGRFPQAIDELRRVVLTMPRDDRSDSRVNAAEARLGLALLADGRSDEAIAVFRTTLERARRQLGAGHRIVNMTHHLIGGAQFEAGDFAAAAASARAALEGWDVDGGRSQAGSMHQNLGLALWGQGRLDEAGAQLRRALALKTRDRPTANADTAWANTLVALGRVEVDRGQVESGLKRMDDGLAAFGANGPRSLTIEHAGFVATRIQALLSLGRDAEARAVHALIDPESRAARAPTRFTLARWVLAEADLALSADSGHAQAEAALDRLDALMAAMRPVPAWMQAARDASRAALALRRQTPDAAAQAASALQAIQAALPTTDRLRVLAEARLSGSP